MKKTVILDYVGDIPIVKCEPRDDLYFGFKFYCEYCKRDHLHGAGLGHRSAHCDKLESPFRKTGYILCSIPPFDMLLSSEPFVDEFLEFTRRFWEEQRNHA